MICANVWCIYLAARAVGGVLWNTNQCQKNSVITDDPFYKRQAQNVLRRQISNLVKLFLREKKKKKKMVFYEVKQGVTYRTQLQPVSWTKIRRTVRSVKAWELSNWTRIQTLLLNQMITAYLVDAAAISKAGLMWHFHHKMLYCTLCHDVLLFIV